MRRCSGGSGGGIGGARDDGCAGFGIEAGGSAVGGIVADGVGGW